MNFPLAIGVVIGHAQAAAAMLSTPITDVAQGNPIPTGRCGRVWYGGEMQPPHMATNRVLTGELVGEAIHIVFFWPFQGASGTTAAAQVDDDCYTLKHELRTRILGDSTLGGNVTDLDLEYMTSDVWQAIDGTQYRTLEATVVLSFSEYTAAP